MTKRPAAAAGHFAAEARRLGLCWLALLALMTTSLGAAYLRLGVGNVFVALGIAVIKTGIVGWWFMHLRNAIATTRLAAGVALVMLAILLTLSGVDYLTRVDEPAALQPPAQIEPIVRSLGAIPLVSLKVPSNAARSASCRTAGRTSSGTASRAISRWKPVTANSENAQR